MLRVMLLESEIRRCIGLAEEGTRVVEALAPLGEATSRCLYFLNKKVTTEIREFLSARDGCIVIAPTGSGLIGNCGDCVVLDVDDPRQAIARVLNFVTTERQPQSWVSRRRVEEGVNISPFAVVADLVEIDVDAVIEPFCVIEADVSIGRGAIIKSGTKVYSRVKIGDQTTVGSNSVIGHQGYSFVRNEVGNKTRMPHLGGVTIGSHVEIGAMVTVPSGTISPTIIEDRAKIDDHVHVAHNVRVGRGASVTAGVVIGGSAVIEEEAWVGVNSSIRDGRRVGSYSLVGMDSSIQQSLDHHSVVRAPRPDITKRDDDDYTSIGFK